MNGNGRGRRPDSGGRPPQPRSMRTMAFWILMLILIFVAVPLINYNKEREYKVDYTRFMDQLEANNIARVIFDGQRLHGVFRRSVSITEGTEAVDVQRFYMNIPYALPDLPEQIRSHSTDEHPILIDTEEPRFNWWGTLAYWAPILLLVFLWFFFIRQMQGGSNRAFSFGKSRAKLVGGDKPMVTFEDVAGAEEAKVELAEIVEFLSDPKKFKRMGARIPRGCLLVGPPGTGKTLLGKAVAGEARVPFFSMSGSDFVEMFVGVGASRVRDLFEQGKKNAPCIIFVDELDAVGRHRGAGLGGGHDEREQTLNQLLVEMDGFDTSDGVIILAATNRPDVLDPALLRPGRFDRQIVVDMPDLKGREGILKVHMRKVPIADDVDLNMLARSTPGLSGADLANIVNEGALLAARRNHDRVYMIDFEDAKDKVMLGPERKSRVMKEDTRRKTAYHEAGHAIVGIVAPQADTLHKVTIVSRGRAGGVTYFLPEEDRLYYVDREYILDKMTMALGGRVAEELILDKISSGAQDDIRKVTDMARAMITRFGMSDKLGPIAYGENEETIFLGRSVAHTQNFSERTAQMIDDEVRSVVEECLERARAILAEHIDALHRVADALMERETLSGDDVQILMRGEELPPFDREAAEAARRKVQEKGATMAERIDAALAEDRNGDTGEMPADHEATASADEAVANPAADGADAGEPSEDPGTRSGER